MKKSKKEYDIPEESISKMYDDKLDGVIPEDLYKKKLNEYKEKQRDILIQIEEHNESYMC